MSSRILFIQKILLIISIIVYKSEPSYQYLLQCVIYLGFVRMKFIFVILYTEPMAISDAAGYNVMK